MEWGWDNARALMGIALIFAIGWGLSEKRSQFPVRLVLGAVVMQFAFALLLFGIPFVRNLLFKANFIVEALQEATRNGTSFVFGYVGDNQAASEIMTGDAPPLFFFWSAMLSDFMQTPLNSSSAPNTFLSPAKSCGILASA